MQKLIGQIAVNQKILKDSIQMRGLIFECFPHDKKFAEQMFSAVECGIVDEIFEQNDKLSERAEELANRVLNEYLWKREDCLKVVDVWLQIYSRTLCVGESLFDEDASGEKKSLISNERSRYCTYKKQKILGAVREVEANLRVIIEKGGEESACAIERRLMNKAKHGDEEALEELNWDEEFYKSLPTLEEEAIRLFQLAHDYMRQGLVQEAKSLLIKSADLGYREAIAELGGCYQSSNVNNGRKKRQHSQLDEIVDDYYSDCDYASVEEQFEKTEKWKAKKNIIGKVEQSDVEKAADDGWLNADITHVMRFANNGNANAQFALGMRYRQGKGVPVSSTLAYEWFAKAAKQGHVKAKKMYEYLRKMLGL